MDTFDFVLWGYTIGETRLINTSYPEIEYYCLWKRYPKIWRSVAVLTVPHFRTPPLSSPVTLSTTFTTDGERVS